MQVHFTPLIVSVLATLAAGDTRFEFMSSQGNALSSLTGKVYNAGDLNTIYSQPKWPYEKGIQLFYRQLSQDDASTPTVTVTIVNTASGESYAVQRGFNIISQTCSCYWLDAAQLVQQNPGLSSGRYVLQFQSDPATEAGRLAVNERSGAFGIMVGASPDTAPPAVTTGTVNRMLQAQAIREERDDCLVE